MDRDHRILRFELSAPDGRMVLPEWDGFRSRSGLLGKGSERREHQWKDDGEECFHVLE